ncbi:unnamed protein product [Rangifer tarandus platyrhynchus]|uniref:Uncharacterized protein n=1 Tax=Rangifer tarandus platyrhynchus TaxID=3082113 RepID=A0ABN8Z7S3_RANTA|nr:unnamed protein product [Rangifer tarandus platyrhynchus]
MSISFLPRGCLFLIHQLKKPGGFSLQPGQRCLGCGSPAAALRSPKRCPHDSAVKQIKSPRTPVAQFPPVQLWESGFSRRKPQESNLEKTPKSHPPPNPLPAPEETGKPGEIPFPRCDTCTQAAAGAASGAATASFGSANAGRRQTTGIKKVPARLQRRVERSGAVRDEIPVVQLS